ncbi:carboxypeptidase-like regulatory domain-containing protein [Ekhidna sp.]|uniref:TonB-dependent receptor n=1 Tax=Ekhidna sp. TaxID=2608089 RepID=UPI003299EEDD
MMRYFLFVSLLVTSMSGFSQDTPCDRSIKGQVIDIDTNEPLPFATVKIVGTSLGAVSNEEGSFLITGICEDEVDLEIRFVGYKTLTHHHDFHHNTPIIYMAADETLLESVVVEQELNAHELKTLEPINIKVDQLASLGTSAGDLFSQSAGVSTLKTGQNIVKPVVHGLHSNRVLIINNGVRHSYQSWGAEHGVEIDASQIDRIQLIKGASTVRYGSDALGGVILVNAPESSFNTKLNGEANVGFQSNGRSLSGEISLNQGFERAAWIATASATKQGDLNAPDYQLTNTGKEEISLTAGAKFHFPIVDLKVYVSHFEQTLGILRGSVSDNLAGLAEAIRSPIPSNTKSFSYEINNPRQETIHDLLKLESALFLGEQQFDFQYALQRNQRKEFDVRRGTNNERPAINLNLMTHTIDIDWDHPSKGLLAGTLGAQFINQNNDNRPGTNTIPFVPNYNTNTLGLFAIESLEKESLTYEAGIRFDLMNMNVRGRDSNNDIYRDNLNYQNFTFTLGLLKEWPNFSIRTNIGTAWRAPNINELYSFGKHQSVFEFGLWRYELFPSNDSISTQNVLTNDDREVESERGLKWIGTINYHSNDWKVEFTPYVNWINNYFFLRPYGITETVRGTFPYFIHDQTDAIYTGLDLNIQKMWNESFSADFKLAYVYAKDRGNDQRFVGIPPLNIQLSLEKRIGNFVFEFYPEFEASQSLTPSVIAPENFESNADLPFDRSGTFDFVDSPDAFLLMNASIKYTKKNLSIKLSGENLLNSRYRRYTDNIRYYADDLGTNVGLAASYVF